MTNMISIINMHKTFKKTKALIDINITLKEGRIYGLVGQNGAGKTTLIRSINGLSLIDHGSLEIFGKSDQKGLLSARKNIGSMVEHAGLSPHLDAYQNLKLHLLIKNEMNENEIDRVLDIVGLDVKDPKKFKNYSMGMKQRLAIAVALLGNPKLLILDEPMNGLDPLGIIEIRETLKKINKQGISILISSHILSELFLLATDFIFMHQGKIMNALTHEEVKKMCNSCIQLRVHDLIKVKEILDQRFGVQSVIDSKFIKIYDSKITTDMIAHALYEEKQIPLELSLHEKSLESLFVEMVGEANGSNHQS